MTLRIVAPAATFLEALSPVWEYKVELGAEKSVKTPVCCSGKLLSPPLPFVAAVELFTQGIILLISLNYMLLSEFAFNESKLKNAASSM